MANFMENGMGADAANGLAKTAILPAGPPPRPKVRIRNSKRRSYSKLAALEPI
jgi:hypothetical protein